MTVLIYRDTKIAMTYKIAMAAAQDAGNRAMRAGGRKVWSAGDYRKACDELERLLALVPAPRATDTD